MVEQRESKVDQHEVQLTEENKLNSFMNTAENDDDIDFDENEMSKGSIQMTNNEDTNRDHDSK